MQPRGRYVIQYMYMSKTGGYFQTQTNNHKRSSGFYLVFFLPFMCAKNSKSLENRCHSWMNHCRRIEILPPRVCVCVNRCIIVCLCSHSSSSNVMVYMHPAELEAGSQLQPPALLPLTHATNTHPHPFPTPKPPLVTTKHFFSVCGPLHPPSPRCPHRPKQHKRCHRGLKIAPWEQSSLYFHTRATVNAVLHSGCISLHSRRGS